MVTGFLQSALQCLVSFCKSDAANRCIAEDGMHILVDCMTHYFEVPEILKCIFSLLGYLTFVEDNLRAIVQYNGIEAINQPRKRGNDYQGGSHVVQLGDRKRRASSASGGVRR